MGEAERKAVGSAAAALVEDRMRIGVGSGRTVRAWLMALAPRLRAGFRVEAACASEESAALARSLGMRVAPPDEVGGLDLAIDGADLLTPSLDCIKGLGGALARERLVALGARRFVVIAEEEKLRAHLRGERVPVEVLRFGHRDTARRLRGIGLSPVLRETEADAPYLTDNGNCIYDCQAPSDESPSDMEAALAVIPGVVATGYFLSMADEALLAGPGGVRRIGAERDSQGASHLP